MNYHLLDRKEWPRVESKLASFGQQVPNNGLISIAEDTDIRAALCFHPVFHGEPFWVDDAYRGLVDVRRLQRSLTDILPRGLEYFAFTPNRKMRWVAGTCGMKPMPWDIWKGVV